MLCVRSSLCLLGLVVGITTVGGKPQYAHHPFPGNYNGFLGRRGYDPFNGYQDFGRPWDGGRRIYSDLNPLHHLAAHDSYYNVPPAHRNGYFQEYNDQNCGGFGQKPHGEYSPDFGTTDNFRRHHPAHAAKAADDNVSAVLASGRRAPLKLHRRVLDQSSPIVAKLPSGGHVFFEGRDKLREKANDSDFSGAQVYFLSDEALPISHVKETLEDEHNENVLVELPSGDRLPYHEYTGSQRHLHSKMHHTDTRSSLLDALQAKPTVAVDSVLHESDMAIPKEKLFVILGSSQRLLYKVHDAIFSHYNKKCAVEVDLVSGERVKVKSYTELLKKATQDRFIGCTVRVSRDVQIPLETYRAVVDAHNHGGVYVEFPGGKRILYKEYRRHLDESKNVEKAVRVVSEKVTQTKTEEVREIKSEKIKEKSL